ncbi:MAG: HAMP domain-containing protein [Desulfobacterales bacterium]
MTYKPKTLQQQLILFVLLPVALLLLMLGWAGFVYTRTTLLQQWGEATILKLQRAAHQIDMELSHPKGLVAMLLNRTDSRAHGQQALKVLIIDELNRLDGVLRVAVSPVDNSKAEHTQRLSSQTHNPSSRVAETAAGQGMHRAHQGLAAMRVSSPRYDPSLDNQTVSLISDMTASDGSPSGQIELILSFDHLVGLMTKAEWWQHQEALIVDDQGSVLAGTPDAASAGKPAQAELLPAALLQEIARQFSGTLRTRNGGRDRVSGFYRLNEAPWTLVISAPANEVLAPIHRFRAVYLALGLGIVISVLLLIRLTTARAVASIREVSQAAEKVALGDYKIDLPVRGSDEIGELMQRFNTMARQLEEGAHMKRSLLLAQEVQQSLLPAGRLITAGLEIAGDSRYCDETGGDYFDYILLPKSEARQELYAVAVSDVTGHGIAAALLMSTARARSGPALRSPK